MKATFYCDESGNTGTDWINNEQPFFVYGGWLIQDNIRDVIVSKLKVILEKYPGEEIKSKRFFRMGKAYHYFNLVFHTLIEYKAFPVFVITDKRYAVALKIIETFFDPAYNHSLRNEITFDVELKKCMAEMIIGREPLCSFASLIHTGVISMDKMHDIQSALSELMIASPSIARNIKSLSDYELQLMTDEFSVPFIERSLTSSSLHHLLQHLNRFMLEHDIKGNIVHDMINGYDELFKSIKEIYLTPGQESILELHNIQIRSKLTKIRDINLEDSQSAYLIQISDLLCGYISRCFRNISNGLTLDTNENEVLRHLFVLHEELFTWDHVLSKDMVTKFLNNVGFTMKYADRTNPMILDLDFLAHLKV